MGEEQKEEEKKEEGGENKEGEKEKKEEEPPDVLLKVDMHCEGCARKVEKSLRKCEGIEEVKTDSKLRKVVVKGKGADPVKLCERVQKKTGRKAEIISPLPKPPEEEKKKEDAPQPEENKEEPKPITVVLRIRMHCEACAQVLQRRIKKMKGVESVVTNLSNEQVIIKGFVDPAKLVEDVYRRTRRVALIVPDEEKKEEEEEKKEESEKKEEEEKKEGEEGENEMFDAKQLEYWPPKSYLEYAYAYPPPQVFSDENPNACSIM